MIKNMVLIQITQPRFNPLCYNITLIILNINSLVNIHMRLSREEVQRISQLVRMGLDESEIEQFRIQLSDILENMEILKQVDTTNVQPTAQSVNLTNIFRPDKPLESCPTDQILANAPQSMNNFFKVKAVLEE